MEQNDVTKAVIAENAEAKIIEALKIVCQQSEIYYKNMADNEKTVDFLGKVAYLAENIQLNFECRQKGMAKTIGKDLVNHSPDPTRD